MNKLVNPMKWHCLFLIVIVLITDLVSKFLILKNFALGDTVPLFPLLNLYCARNYGAAFGFLANSDGWQRWFFIGISLVVCIMMVVLMYSSKQSRNVNDIAYSMIIGGALGNMFDRLWHGFVVDMIDFYIGDWHFATFNFADSIIFGGAVLIVLTRFF